MTKPKRKSKAKKPSKAGLDKESKNMILALLVSAGITVFLFNIVGLRSLLALFFGELGSWIAEIFMWLIAYGNLVAAYERQAAFRKVAYNK